MTESFSKIEDETFPSFLGDSINSNVTLENCTLTSNLGLPVAASTVAKARSGFDRFPDIQASYLDIEKPSSPNNSTHFNDSGGNAKGKHVSNFKDDLDNRDTVSHFNPLPSNSDIQQKASKDKSNFSSDLCTLPRTKHKDMNPVIPNLYKDNRSQVMENDFDASAAGFIENEKLVSIASLEGSSSDDLDDEEFYDDQLEAYFKKLLPPGMQRGTVEGQEIVEPKRTSYTTGSNIPSRTTNTESERLQFLDDYEENFQMLHVRLAAAGMDSAPSSDDDDDDDVEMELERAARQHLQREQFLENTGRSLVNEQNRPSFRPGLEGGSSDDESSKRILMVSSSSTLTGIRKSAEGDPNLSPMTSATGTVFFFPLRDNLGDGSSCSDDGDKTIQTSFTNKTPSWTTDLVTRNVAGEESNRFLPVKQLIKDREEPVGNGAISKDSQLNSSQLCLTQGSKPHSTEGKKLDSFYFQNGNYANKQPDTLYSQDTKAVNRLADEYLSPVYQESQKYYPDNSKTWNSSNEQPFLWSFGHCENGDDGSPTHSVVYQNEEGKWVTDLAYYKAFDNEQNATFPGIVDDVVNESDFIAGNDALAMIEEDQEEFEKEHRFIQEEKMDLENISVNMGDTSWKMPPNNALLKTSQMSAELCQEDASYLRLSLGEFFGQRSEALGCLGGGQDVKRPSFGYHIISPEKQEPVVLLRSSDISENTEHEDTIKFCDDTLTPDDLCCLPDDQKLACATFDVRAPEKQDDENQCVNVEQTSRQCSPSEELLAATGERMNEKSKPTKDNSFLSISTIAAAIAGASASADPSELATIIMELSNKNKNVLRDSASENVDCSVSDHMTLENCAPENIIDMERYLKVTKMNGRESGTQSFMQSVKDFTWDMSLQYKQALQDCVDLTNITVVQEQDLNKPDVPNEIQSSPLPSETIFEKTKVKAVCRVASIGNDSKAGDLGNIQTKLRQSMTKPTDTFHGQQSGHRTNNKCTTDEKEKGKILKSVAPMRRTSNASENKGKPLMERVKEQSQGTDCKPRESESSSQPRSHIPRSSKILKSPRRSTSRLSNEPKSSHPVSESKQLCEDTHQKHVTFQTSASVAVPIKETAFPGHEAHGFEEEQYSFRPSTSPLIHSSPSQDSLKISEQGSVDSSNSTASESTCVSPSLSRLTYISMAENTLQTTTVPSPEKKGNNTIELSTTIVRASPTPSEMINPAILSWQHTNSQLSGSSPLKTSNQPSASYAVHGQNDEFLKLQGKNQQEGSLLNMKEKMNAAGSTLDALHYIQTPSVQGDIAFPYQKFLSTKSVQEFGSTNILSAGTLDNYPMMPGIPLTGQYIPAFKPAQSATDSHKLLPSVPTLLTGQPLSATAFAQQYLGSMSSIGNTAAQTYQSGGSALYNNHGHPSCTIPAQHMQTNVAGIQMNTNVGSELLATLPMSSHMSSKADNFIPTSGYPAQSFGAAGLQQWGTRLSSGFGQVLVPEELTFPSACCVGIASQASLNIFNPNERWMQVNLGILSIAINGEKIDVSAYQCLVFKNKTIIGPRAAEEMKFLFLPQRSGLFQCVLSVSSWPVSTDPETILRAEAMASKVLLTAVSEYPLIEVDTGKVDGLDFGDLTTGSWKALPLKIINRTHAMVPVRLIISANATAWRCFTFSKDPSNLASEYPFQGDLSKMSSPSVISQVMHASHDGQDPESMLIWIVFHAPQSYSSAGSLGPAEEFVARVDVEVDSPGPACVLKSVPLHARAGCARIHAPKDLQTIRLVCNVGSSVKQVLPLKNAGNIAVHLKIKSSNPDSSFAVDPADLFLVPGDEQVVEVKFSPLNLKVQKSILKIMVQPTGPQYEVSVIGEIETPSTRNSMNPSSVNSADVPPILSNKQFMSWGGVTLGRAVQQKLILRNTSTSCSQHLRLLIRGQDQDCFQLQNIFGPEERLTSNRDLTIRAKEDAIIHLMFTPTRVGCMLAKLEIKQSGVKSAMPGIKFTIPLSGYGGTSNLILEDVKKLSDSYMVILNGVSSGRVRKIAFCIRNTGSRAAYVKAVCFADFQKSVVMDHKVFCVTPEKFVLKEKSQEIITISCNATEREENLCRNSSALISTVCIFCGDEVARQQYRRALQHKPEMAQKIVSENAKLKNTKFDDEFPGEHLVSEVYDLPQRPNDIQLFYGNMNKIILSVIGSGIDGGTSGGLVQMALTHSVDSALGSTERDIENTSLDVLPVKGPQGPLLSSNTNKPLQESTVREQTWSVKPESLVLTAPSLSGIAGTGQVKLINHSTRLIQFELSWPAHCLTITPQHGTVEPQSHLVILVSPNPSLATKHSLLPWNGQIYMHCDNEQKFVKVQISGESHVDRPLPAAAKPVSILTTHLGTPVHMAKPLPKSPPTKVEIKNSTLVFPKTISGESSETFLDMENPGDEDVKWLLSSFAPPYVKGVDQSGDVFRANYAAFRCSRVSGVLAARDNLKVAILFFPRDRGDYAQYWDLECHPISEPHLKHKVRFQLCGEGNKGEGVSERGSADSLVKTEVTVMPRRRSGSEASTLKAMQEETSRGVFAPEELYTFPPTMVGDSSTLKVNLQNNSFSTYMLKFVSPGEPFHMKHSKYSLRAHHYINLPVKFKPSSSGKFDGHLVVQADTGNICIRLAGEALDK
ncbi:centrosomal protein of 192 kDa [Pelodytes ibericus]